MSIERGRGTSDSRHGTGMDIQRLQRCRKFQGRCPGGMIAGVNMKLKI